MTASRRSFLRATGGTAAGLALAGCASTDQPESSTTTAEPASDRDLRQTGTTLVTLDPAASADGASNRVVSQLYDGLVHFPHATLPPEPLLASDVSVSADRTTYQFTIDADATFHTGESVTAADVVYTFERLAASPNSKWSGLLLSTLGVTHETTEDGSYEPGSLGVRAVDEQTVEIELSSPFHAALEVFALPGFGVVPEGVVGDIEGYDGRLDYETFATEQPVGAGPFEFDFWKKGTAYRVSARDDYRRDGPHVAGIRWQVISNPSTAFTYAKNGNADIFWVPNSEYDPGKVSVDHVDDLGRKVGTYGPLSNGKTVDYLQVPLISTYLQAFNTEQVPKPVRQAVAYAMDQSLQVEQVHKGRGRAATHITPPNIFPGGTEGYANHAEQYPYGTESRLDEAQRVMEAAGYGPDSRFDLEFTIYMSNAWQRTAKILRDKLEQAYVDLTVEQVPFNGLVTRARKGNVDMFALGWIADYPAVENFLKLLNPPTDRWFTRWSETPAAERANEAWQTISSHPTSSDADREARRDAYLTVEEANWEDVVLLPKFHPVGERFSYQWVDDLAKTGPVGFDKRMYDQVRVGERDL